MRRNLPLITDAREVTRPVCLSVLAMAVVASAMALTGRSVSALVLTALLVLLAGVLVFLVHRSNRYFRGRESDLQRLGRQAEEHYADVLRRIVRFTEARDHYTVGHSERVGSLSERIARQIGLCDDLALLLRQAGELHDIGLVAISDEVLNERARIGVDGYRSVKRHSEIGYEVLKPLGFLQAVLPAVRHHHERMNGTGYPDGLVGEDIPIAARVLAVADAFDAMTHDRPHRPAMTRLQAMRELQRCTPAGYCKRCVDGLAALYHFDELKGAMAEVSPATLNKPSAPDAAAVEAPRARKRA